ncbi:hypothetical protein CMV_027252 [Castanea mollissima]|uniref:PB1 domain-containing protein n=1 Tax=Castanea mollissima TaxID=60419 RepID=A0A8J4Q6T5_9ROSI|nr:hypothetical protein CMV_027252 [Castanea mollissima]
MAGEASGPSAQRIHQQQPTLVMPNVNNNVSVRTGEEFSLEFMQDRVGARRVPAVANSGQKREKRVVFNYDQNGQLGYEDLTGLLGLRRIDSETTSDMSVSEYASARTSFNAKEMENGAYVDKSSKYYKEDGDSGHGSRKAFGELNFDRTGMGIPIPPPLHKSGSPHSNNYPGPSDGKLRYVGGDTHIISIWKRITREELMKKTLGIWNQPHTIKYQLPDEDLDALRSVSSDEDLQNMIEEYCGLERHGGSQRLRIFLIPLCESEILSSFDGNTIQQNSPDYQYVVAVNGILDHTPRKNTSGMSLASEADKLGTNLDRIPSLHRSSPTAPVPLELKGGFNALQPAQFFNQSQNMSRSPNHSPPHSPVPLQQEDSKSVHMQLHGDNSRKSSNESSSSSLTTQLPSEDSSANTAGSKYLQQGAVTLMNHHHPYKQVDVGHPEHRPGEHIHNCNSSKETTSSVDRNDSDFDGFSYEKPMHKERTFHSEKPTSRPEDPLGLFSGSSDSIDSHRGMSHAFSDSKLNENGGSSAYCSQEGMSPLSPLNFPKAQPPLHLSASQEKPLQPNENIGLVYPQVQYMLVDVDPTGSQSRLDLLNSSTCSEIPSWNKPIYKTSGSLYGALIGSGENILPNVKSNLTSSFGVDTSAQELQVSGDALLVSSAINFKPFVDNIIEHPKNFQVEKTPPDLVMSQRTANDQDCDMTTRVIGEQEKDISGFGNSEVAGLYPSARQQSYDENSFSDLMSGSIYGLASHAPPLLQPIGSQNDMAINEPKLMSSIDLYPSAVLDDSDLSSNLNKNDHTLIGNPAEYALFMRDFSLLDADFVSYPYQKVENLGFGGSVCEKSNVKDSTLENLNFPIKSHEKNQLESVIGEDVNETIHSHVQSLLITVPYILDETSSYNIDFGSPAATEVEGSVIPEFESEDAKADDEDITFSISDAMIAEMEASIYGLQDYEKTSTTGALPILFWRTLQNM